MKDKIKTFIRSVRGSVIAILAGMVLGIIIMLAVGVFNSTIGFKGFLDGARLLCLGIFCEGRDAVGSLIIGFNGVHVGNALFRAVPLIMTGLSVAVGLKSGLLNIGAAGQYLIGTMMTLVIALSIPSNSVPAAVILILALLGGIAAGAVWGMIPGALKAYLNVNEVISCILCNWIAANLVTVIFEGSKFINTTDPGKTGMIYKTSTNGVELPTLGLDKLFKGSQINSGIIIAILIAIGMYILLKKSQKGFEMRICGTNREAARYCGINEKSNILFSMGLAGALAGAGAALYMLSGNTEFAWSSYQSLPAVGFNGIPVALLACLNPIGVIFTSAFMSALEVNGQQIANLTAYNEYITSIIIGVIVYLSAFTAFVNELISKKRKKGGKK